MRENKRRKEKKKEKERKSLGILIMYKRLI
jgi:hypothetical protein